MKKWKKENLQPVVKHDGRCIMLWSCMLVDRIGELVFIDKNVNKETYLQILKANLHKSAEKFDIEETLQFYHENNPKHKA